MRTRGGDKGDARQRFDLGIAYVDLAGLADADSGRAAIQAAVGNYVLAAIAFADAICLARLGRRSADPDHAQAAQLLSTVDRSGADALKKVLSYKTRARSGPISMSTDELKRAERLTAVLRRLATQALS